MHRFTSSTTVMHSQSTFPLVHAEGEIVILLLLYTVGREGEASN